MRVPFVDPVAEQLTDVLCLALPDVADAEIDPVLMVAANQMNRTNDLAGDTLGARGVINPLLILGERLYRGGTTEPRVQDPSPVPLGCRAVAGQRGRRDRDLGIHTCSHAPKKRDGPFRARVDRLAIRRMRVWERRGIAPPGWPDQG